ncbi:ABC transporter substrate-binding protein [Sphingomonas sp. NCPPB 2930]
MNVSRRSFSGALLGTGLAMAASPSAWAQEGHIVLGQSTALTGPVGPLGIQYGEGARLCFDQVNAQGGIGRRLIELKTLDDAYDPGRCAENTRKLLAEDVTALFGYVGTATSQAALPLATQAHVAFIAPLTGAPALREPSNRYAFFLRASYDEEAEVIVKQQTSMNLNRIGIVHQTDAFGKIGLNGFVKALAARKLQPSAVVAVDRDTVDMSGAVKNFSTRWPEAIVLVGTLAPCEAFIRAARMAGFGGMCFCMSVVDTQTLGQNLGPVGAGVVVAQVLPSPFKSSHAASREFVEAIKKGGNKVKPGYTAFEGYLAARVLVEGMRRARGTLDRDSLVGGMESIGNATIAGLPVAFSATNHVASKFVELSMLTGDGRVKA